MKWRQPNAYHIASNCGRYTVAKTRGPPGVRYTAWHTASRPHRILGTHDNAADARVQCERHAAQQPGEPHD